MFVEFQAKMDFAPLGAKQPFRTYGAGRSWRSECYKHLAPNGAKAVHMFHNLARLGRTLLLIVRTFPGRTNFPNRSWGVAR